MNELREVDLDLAAGYALGVLDDAERREVERRLKAGDAALQQAVDEFAQSSSLLGSSLPAQQPSPRLRERVLSEVHQESWNTRAKQSTSRGQRDARVERFGGGWPSGWGWIAVAAALAVVSYLQFDAGQKLRNEVRAASVELDRVRATLAEERLVAEVFAAPDARVVRLGATPDGDSALVAQATYDPATQRAVVTFDHFAAPTGRDYQLWAIRDGKPASLGIIRVDANGKARMRLNEVGSATSLAAFAVSLEPTGGSPNPSAPSGPVVMVGKVAG